MSTRRILSISGLLAVLTACAGTHPSIQINNARTALVAAQQSEEGRRVPAELLVAQRTLEAADRAQADEPDSAEVRDLVYIADRQTRTALAHGRRMALAEQVQGSRLAYQRDLETTNRNTRSQLENTEAALSQTGQQVQQANAQLAQTSNELEEERRARIAAERRAADAMARVQELASVREQNNETVITILGALLFRSGGSQLLPGAEERLTAVATALREQPDRMATVVGYTDSTGSAATNDILSRARAESVREFLVSHGVPADRIRAEGRGPLNPVADNTTAEGRANNRRVEIVLAPAAATTTTRTTTTTTQVTPQQ